ncbi:MAG: 50S ribosomal protein L30 [Tissierellia bacterium]|jgi:large subunit ribosomal protein L30|nr:50S ribosomal protein L30 [Tissierellia bacterium]
MKLKIKLIKSTIGSKPVHRKNIEALGLKRIGQVVERDDSPITRGMIKKASHLLEVEEVK